MSTKTTYRDVWALALPMILCNTTIPLLGIVDTAVMGHLPQAYYIGAVALGAMVFDFIYWSFGFLRMGTTGFVAQAHGQQDGDAIRTHFAQATLLGVMLALAIVILQWPILYFSVVIIHPAPDVIVALKTYFHIRIWAAPAVLINYVIIGWFIGMQNTRIPLLLLILTNSIGIILDLFFVFGLGFNVGGVACATVIAQYVGMLLGLYCLKRALRCSPGRWYWRQILSRQKIKQFFSININLFIRTLFLLFSFAFFTTQSTQLGTATLAINTILMNMQRLMAYSLDGFAHAAEALVGKAIGALQRDNFVRTVKQTAVLSFWVASVFTLIFWLFGTQLIHLMTDQPNLRQLAQQYLPWMIIMPLISVWSYWLDGVFIGASKARQMRNTILIAVIGFYLPAWYLTLNYGNHGLWFSMTFFMLMRTLIQLFYYFYLDRAGQFITIENE